jgi:hypothetical protein
MRASLRKDAADSLFHRHGPDQGLKDLEALCSPQFRFTRPLRMRHHPEYIPARAANSSNIFQRAVGIGFRRDLAGRVAVTEHYLLVALQLAECCLVTEIVAFHVADRDGQNFVFMARTGEGSFGVLNAHLYRFADVLQPDIPHQCSRQQAGLAQDLEAITDSDHQSAAFGEFLNRLHHGRELGYGAGAQVVAISKPAGDDDRVAVLQIMRIMPQECDRLPGHILDRPVRIMVTVGAGENDDAKFHLYFPRGGDSPEV